MTPIMRRAPLRLAGLWCCLALAAAVAVGQTPSPPPTPGTAPATPGAPAPPAPTSPPTLKAASTNYILSANDIIEIRVFREDDLTTRVRLAKDGTVIFPLVGSVQVGGRTVPQATEMIRDLLGRDYLVDPQVTISIVDFAKRRFTIMGEVNRPGAYDMPDDQPLNLLQAISMAGGYTRIANPSKITVQRLQGDRKTMFQVDAKAMARDRNTQVFEIQPEDAITVAESIF